MRPSLSLVIALFLIHYINGFRYLTKNVFCGRGIHSLSRFPVRNQNAEHDHIFKQWEVEEQEKQEEALRSLSNRDDVHELPDYVLAMLDQYDSDAVVPITEAQLPIIAVLGRPNTGKSTIVNKIANSQKVRYAVTILTG
jgi:polynucleotide 5'-kinase involved in rRNA processing